MANPLTRTLMLHTGGSFWVNVTGIEGARDDQLLRWVPGSPRIDLGLVGSALVSLPFLSSEWGRRVSHFMLELAPQGPSPSGQSGHLAIVAATLWYQYAAQTGLPVVRAGAPLASGQPLTVLTGAGTLRQQPTDYGLYGYRVAPVGGWAAKVRQLDAALAGTPVAELHLLCPHEQAPLVQELLIRKLIGRIQPGRNGEALIYGHRTRVFLHPVGSLQDIVYTVDNLLVTQPSPAEPEHLFQNASPNARLRHRPYSLLS